MKVKELIEALKAYDGELEVFTYAEDSQCVGDFCAIEESEARTFCRPFKGKFTTVAKGNDLDFPGVLLS